MMVMELKKKIITYSKIQTQPYLHKNKDSSLAIEGQQCFDLLLDKEKRISTYTSSGFTLLSAL